MREKLPAVVESMRSSSLRLCGVTEKTYPTVRALVKYDVNNLTTKLMALADVDLGLEDKDFEEFCTLLIRAISKYHSVFIPLMVDFFIKQFGSRGWELEQTIGFLKKTFKEEAPNGSRWKFERREDSYMISDITRNASFDIITVTVGGGGSATETVSPMVKANWGDLPQN